MASSAQIQKLIEARNEKYGKGFNQLDINQVTASLTDNGLVFNDIGKRTMTSQQASRSPVG